MKRILRCEKSLKTHTFELISESPCMCPFYYVSFIVYSSWRKLISSHCYGIRVNAQLGSVFVKFPDVHS